LALYVVERLALIAFIALARCGERSDLLVRHAEEDVVNLTVNHGRLSVQSLSELALKDMEIARSVDSKQSVWTKPLECQIYGVDSQLT
jgi:hypothetical protein